MKLGWRILNDPKVLWVHILKEKYLAKESFIYSSIKAHCSALRRGIQKIKPTLLWLVVNGENIEIFTDRWIPQMSKPIAKPLDFLITISRVYQLISSNMGKWDEELIRDCFNNATATSILHTPIN